MRRAAFASSSSRRDAIQKRYGKRDMLALILDLPVCAECFGKMTRSRC
jgi:hypothetical protein